MRYLTSFFSLIFVFAVTSFGQETVIEQPTELYREMRLAPDGSLLAWIDGEKLKICREGEEVREIPFNTELKYVPTLKISRDSQRLIVYDSLQEGGEIISLKDFESKPLVRQVGYRTSFLKDGLLHYNDSRNRVIIVRNSGKRTELDLGRASYFGERISPSGNWWAYRTSEGEVKIYGPDMSPVTRRHDGVDFAVSDDGDLIFKSSMAKATNKPELRWWSLSGERTVIPLEDLFRAKIRDMFPIDSETIVVVRAEYTETGDFEFRRIGGFRDSTKGGFEMVPEMEHREDLIRLLDLQTQEAKTIARIPHFVQDLTITETHVVYVYIDARARLVVQKVKR